MPMLLGAWHGPVRNPDAEDYSVKRFETVLDRYKHPYRNGEDDPSGLTYPEFVRVMADLAAEVALGDAWDWWA